MATLSKAGRKPAHSLPDLLTIAQVAKLLGVTRSAVAYHCRSGALPAKKFGPRIWEIRREAALAFASASRKPGRRPKTGLDDARESGDLDPSTTLRGFFDRHLADQLPRYQGEAHAAGEVRRAIGMFNTFLKRTPLLSDLNETTYRAFLDWLDARESERKIEHVRKGLRVVWAAAFRLTLVESPAVDMRQHREFAESWRRADAEPRDQAKPETLRQLYLDHYAPHVLRLRSDKTKHHYRLNLSRFDKFLGRAALLSDLNDDTVGALCARIVEEGRSVATANKFRKDILAMWRFAARKRFVGEWPDVPAFKEPIRTPRAWTESELARLWQACASTPGKIAGVAAGAWWTALHHVLWFSGERIRAVLSLRWDDFDAETGWLVVPAEVRKGGKADKATELPPVAVAAIEAIREPRRNLIFEWDRSESVLWNHYKKILRRAGLSADRRSKFHRIRRSAASHYQAAGGSAQLLCGHSNAKVTEGYLDPRIAKPPQAAALLFTPGERKGVAQ